MLVVLYLFGVFVVVLIGAIIWWSFIYYTYYGYLKKVPRPLSVPLLGVTYQLSNSIDVFSWLQETFTEFGGKDYWFMLGPYPTLCTADPKFIAAVHSSPKGLDKPILYDKSFKEIAPDNLLIVNGDTWKRQRKLLNPAFDYSLIKKNIGIFNEQADVLVNNLFVEVYKKSTDVHECLTWWSLNQVYKTMFGTTGESLKDIKSYIHAVQNIQKIAVDKNIKPLKHLPLISFFTRYYWIWKRCLLIIHNHTKVILQRKLTTFDFTKEDEKPIFIEMLLKKQRTNKEFTDEFIASQVNLMIIAGFDTTSAAVTFALYALATNPEVQEKAFQEVHEILGGDKHQPITHEHVKEMRYLELVIKEALRMYSAVPMYMRRLSDDLEYEGVIYPKGLDIIFVYESVHKNPDIYPEPDKFIPERFLPENVHPNQYAYGPFGHGIRSCIGRKFAMLSMTVVLAKILLSYKIVDVHHKLVTVWEIVRISKTGVKVALRKREMMEEE